MTADRYVASSSANCTKTPPVSYPDPGLQHYQGTDHEDDDDSLNLYEFVQCCRDSSFDEKDELHQNSPVVVSDDDDSTEFQDGQHLTAKEKYKDDNKEEKIEKAHLDRSRAKSEDTLFGNIADNNSNKTSSSEMTWTAVAVSAFKERPDTQVGLVFTRLKNTKSWTNSIQESNNAVRLAVIARVVPTSIFAKHTHQLEGGIIRQVNAIPVLSPCHAAELVRGAVGQLKLTVDVIHRDPKKEIEIQLLKHEQRMLVEHLARKTRKDTELIQWDENNGATNNTAEEEDGSADPRIEEYESDNDSNDENVVKKEEADILLVSSEWSEFNAAGQAFPKVDVKKEEEKAGQEQVNTMKNNEVNESRLKKKSRAATSKNVNGVTSKEKKPSSQHGAVASPVSNASKKNDEQNIVQSAATVSFSAPVDVYEVSTAEPLQSGTHPLSRECDNDAKVEDVPAMDQKAKAQTHVSVESEKKPKRSFKLGRLGAFGRSNKKETDVDYANESKPPLDNDISMLSTRDIMNDLESLNPSRRGKESREGAKVAAEKGEGKEDAPASGSFPTKQQQLNDDANLGDTYAVPTSQESSAIAPLLERASSYMVQSVVNNLSYGYAGSVSKTMDDHAALFVAELSQRSDEDCEGDDADVDDAVQEEMKGGNNASDHGVINQGEIVSAVEDTVQVKKRSFIKRVFQKKSKKILFKKEAEVSKAENDYVANNQDQACMDKEEVTNKADSDIDLSCYKSVAKHMEAVLPLQMAKEKYQNEESQDTEAKSAAKGKAATAETSTDVLVDYDNAGNNAVPADLAFAGEMRHKEKKKKNTFLKLRTFKKKSNKGQIKQESEDDDDQGDTVFPEDDSIGREGHEDTYFDLDMTPTGVEIHTPSRGGLFHCPLSPISALSLSDKQVDYSHTVNINTTHRHSPGSNHDATASLTDESNSISFNNTPPPSRGGSKTPLAPAKVIGDGWNVESFLFGEANPPSPSTSLLFRFPTVCGGSYQGAPTTTNRWINGTSNSDIDDEPLTIECKLQDHTASSIGNEDSVKISIARYGQVRKQKVDDTQLQSPPPVNRKLKFDTNEFCESLCEASFQSRAVDDIATVHREKDDNSSTKSPEGTIYNDKTNQISLLGRDEISIEEFAQAKQNAFHIVKHSRSTGRNNGQQQRPRSSQHLRIGSSVKFLKSNCSIVGGARQLQPTKAGQEASISENMDITAATIDMSNEMLEF